ncbi:hypothetical protein Tco_0591064 [Tanacetum coccineum]
MKVLVKLRTLANGTQQLIASIDSKEYTITKASVRNKLQLADATGIHNLSDAEIYAGLATLGYVTEGAAVNPGEGSAQPAEPHYTPVDPISSTSHSPHPSPPHPSPLPHSPLPSLPHPLPLPHLPLPSPPHSPLPSLPHPSPPPHSPPPSPHQSPPFSLPHYSPPRSYKLPLPEGSTSASAEDIMQLKELIDIIPKLVSRVETLETELQQTITTYGKAVLTLVKRVKILEKSLKRKTQKVVISGSEGGIQDRERQILLLPTKVQGAQEEEISPTILEAAKTLSKIDTGLDAEEEINTGREEINTGIEEVSTGSTKVDFGTANKMGQREGKAPMIDEDIQATHKTKEQLRQKEAGLEEAIKLQAQLDEEVAKQIHLDKMIAKRMAEEDALRKQKKKKLSNVLGQDLLNKDLQKKIDSMVNQQKETLCRGREIKEEFDKLVRDDTYVPINLEATKARLKRYGEELQDKTSKKQKEKKKANGSKGINVDKTCTEDSEENL